ncbi:MAG: imelysin family protein [Gemmatimonadota bacterium]|nr:imelysin family protein [Gemmatimonadota bacterium]
MTKIESLRHTCSRLPFLLLLAIGVLGIGACSSDDGVGPDPEEEAFDLRPILQNEADNVILATYADLDLASEGLLDAVVALRDATTEANLEAARSAWRATRVPWESSESFLFGPVDTQGLDPALDSWPVNEVDLAAVLEGDQELTQGFVAGLEGTLKGFHTIEFLLWGVDGSKAPGDFTDREFEYLIAATQALEADATALNTAWDPGGDNFAAELSSAGDGSTIWQSEKAGVQELVNGMIVIADEVANGKINDPLAQQSVFPVESRFSGNSLTDFRNNIESIRNIYTGDYGGSEGMGVDELIRDLDGDLGQRFVDQVDAAISAIQAVPEPFRDAIFDHTAEAEAAQEAVREILQILEEEIAPAVSEL